MKPDLKEAKTHGAARIIADAICADHNCRAAFVPCDRAEELALKIMKALDKYGIGAYQIDGVATGDLRTCDGYCHEFCDDRE